MKYKADVVVTLKNGIRDPQGSAIATILRRMKIENEPNVGVGKFFTIEVEENTEDGAKAKLEHIAQEVLSNPILEKYEITRFEAL
jgi:phosphoribosylformylglycinamidine synthase subunit PurS